MATPMTIVRRAAFVGILRRGCSVSAQRLCVRTMSSSDKIIDDKSLYTLTRKPSPYALGKHRSNALSLVSQQPVIEVDGDMAICDGGGGALGHPLEYIYIAHGAGGERGVDCIYCSLRYRQKKKGGHH